jgi:hypothetical protein
MKNFSGIQYSNDNRFLLIDVQKYSKYDWFEDFIDLLEVEASQNDEKVSLDDFNSYVDNMLKHNV